KRSRIAFMCWTPAAALHREAFPKSPMIRRLFEPIWATRGRANLSRDHRAELLGSTHPITWRRSAQPVSSSELQLELRDDQVAVITLAAPDRRNAFVPELA